MHVLVKVKDTVKDKFEGGSLVATRHYQNVGKADFIQRFCPYKVAN